MEKELAIFKDITPRKEGLDAGNLRKHIFELKEKVWDFEENNLQYIVFYHRENQWWQVGDNSMLIYYYYLAKSIGAKNLKIRHDRDYNKKKWRYGYLTTGNIEKIKEQFVAIECKLIIEKSEIVVFRLKSPIKESDMEIFKHAEELKTERFNSLVVPVNRYPRIMSQAAILQREVVNKAANLSEARRKYYGDLGVELISWIAYNAIRTANGRMEPETYFAKALEKSYSLNDWLAYVKKFDMFNIDTDLRIAQANLNLIDLICKELNKIQKKKDKAKKQSCDNK